MEEKLKSAVEKYQCAGCISGHDTTCFVASEVGGLGCGKHYSGTIISTIGKIFLGLPKGFNRLGHNDSLFPRVFQTFGSSEWKYGMFNVPVWKHLTKDGHTLVRGIMPRRNETFLHIFLENCLDKIDCLEITEDNIDQMD